MNSLMIFVATLIILLLSAALLVPPLVDWTSYRTVFEAKASELVGRTVHVRGKVNLNFLPQPYIRFEDVRVDGPKTDVSEAVGAEPQKLPAFMTAKAFTLWLSAPPLLRGVIDVKEIELDAPKLRLAFGADGSGNWEGLGPTGSAKNLAAEKIKLESLKIKNGQLDVVRQLDGGAATHGADAQALATITDISGVLSAVSLNGPFKFEGAVDLDGRQQTLQISTGRLSKDGLLPLKALMEAPETGGRASLGGTFMTRGPGQGGKPSFTGNMRVLTPVRQKQKAQSALIESVQKRIASGPKIEFKATVAATLTGAKLSPATLSFPRKGAPQSMNGRITLDWSRDVAADAYFSSRLLDLAHLRSTSQDETKEAAAQNRKNLFHGIMQPIAHLTKGIDRGRFEAEISQINLGREAIENFALTLEKDGRANGLKIKTFTTRFPGRNTVSLSGRYGAGGTDNFRGSVELYGADLERMIGWVLPGTPEKLNAAEHGFSLRASIEDSIDGLRVSEARGEVGGTGFKFSLDARVRRLAGAGSNQHAAKTGQSGLNAPMLQPVKFSAQSTKASLAPQPIYDLRVQLEIRRLNIGALAGGAVPAAALRSWFTAKVADNTASPPQKSALLKRISWLKTMMSGSGVVGSMDIDVKSGEVYLADFTGSSFRGRFLMSPERLVISDFAVASQAGMSLSLNGAFLRAGSEAAKTKNSQSGGRTRALKGKLQANLRVKTSAGLNDAVRLIGFDPLGIAAMTGQSQAQLLPLAMAVDAHAMPNAGLHVTLDGSAALAHLKVAAHWAGGLSKDLSWKNQPVVLTAAVDAEPKSEILRLLFPQMPSRKNPKAGLPKHGGTQSDYVQLTASGVPTQGLRTHLDLLTQNVRGRLSGKSVFDGGHFDFTGRLGMSGKNPQFLMGLVGAVPDLPRGDQNSGPGSSGPGSSGSRNSGRGFSLSADFRAHKSIYKLADIDGRLGSYSVTGKAGVDVSNSSGLPRISGQLKMTKAELPVLLNGLVDWDARKVASSLVISSLAVRSEGTQKASASPGGLAVQWPTHPFNLRLFRAFDGQIDIDTSRLEIGGGLFALDAKLALMLDRDVLRVVVKSEQFLGGGLSLDAGFHLKQQVVGVSGKLRVTGAALQELPGGTPVLGASEIQPLARGMFNIDASFSGQGVSPDGLIAALSGHGQAQTGAGAVHRFSTEAARRALDDVNSGRAPPTQFRARFLQRLHGEDLVFPPVKSAFKIVNGLVEFDLVEVADDTGSVRVKTFVSLRGLSLDSEWQIKTPPKTEAASDVQAQLPSVRLAFSGPLSSLGLLPPQVDTKPLERFLQVRKLKQDVERLENLEQQIDKLKKEKDQMVKDADETAVQNWATGVSPANQDLPARPAVPEPETGPTQTGPTPWGSQPKNLPRDVFSDE